MLTTLRKVLIDSHVAAATIATLLFFSLDLMFWAVWSAAYVVNGA